MYEKPVPTGTNVLRYVSLRLLRGDNGNEIQDLAFQLPNTSVAVGYNVVNGQIDIGAPSQSGADVNTQAVNANPSDLSFYWFNGVTWVKVGGTLDEANQVIATKTSFLGDYQIRVAVQGDSLTLPEANVYPRVFTPNGDGLNDKLYIVLLNPNSAEVSGEIFDLKGRLVKSLASPSGQVGVGTTFIWDGSDMNGAVVPSGAYIYRIKGEGKTITGTIAVAR